MIDAVKTGVQSLRRKTASMEDSLLAMENGYYMMDMVRVLTNSQYQSNCFWLLRRLMDLTNGIGSRSHY